MSGEIPPIDEKTKGENTPPVSEAISSAPENSIQIEQFAHVVEPPEAIAGVSEVVGIAEEQKAEINMLGEVSRDLHRAEYTFERIKGLDPEKLKPYEKKFVEERKEYASQFIADARRYKSDVVSMGADLLRGLPESAAIESAVRLNDAATIAELTWRKKNNDQPLSPSEVQALEQAFRHRDKFFDQLKRLGIERDSARVLYDRILNEKTAPLRERLAKESDRERKIAEAKEYFAAKEPQGSEEKEDILFTPELLEAIEALNVAPEKEESERETEDLRALRDEDIVAREMSTSRNGSISELAPPEMIAALKDARINVPLGKKLTVSEAIILRRKVLGRRGTEDIAAMEKRAVKRVGGKDAPVAVPSLEQKEIVIPPEISAGDGIPTADGVEVNELDVEEVIIPPVSENVSSVVRTEEMRRQKARDLLEENSDMSILGVESEEDAGADAETLSLAQVKEQISALETQPSRTEEGEEKLRGLKWLHENAEANRLSDAETTLPGGLIEERVLREYSERFHIDKEVLEGIPGFAELTPGQQLLVLENFTKTAAQDVSVEGLKAYKESLLQSGFFGRAWKNMTKQYQIGKAEGARAEAWREDGSEEVRAMKEDVLGGLTKLALSQKEFDVLEKDGTLKVQFASEKVFGDRKLSDDEKATLALFNEAANHYANLDFTGMEGNQEDLRAVAEKEYQTALTSVTEIFGEENAADGALWQHQVRSAVQMNRFFADDPELEKNLNRSGGMTAFLSGMNTLTERGTIALVGGGLRVAAVGALGSAGLFVSAPIVGGYLGGRRAKQSLKEKDLLARMSEESSDKDALAKNVISAETLTDKLAGLLKEIDGVPADVTVEVARRDEFGDLMRDEAGNIVKETISKRTELLRSLDARVEYTKRKMEEKLVNWGGTNTERITMVNGLMEVLGHADVRTEIENPEVKNALLERLNGFLDVRGEVIDENRKAHVRTEMVRGAVLATGFALAGVGVGQLVRHGIDAGWFGGQPKGQGAVEIAATSKGQSASGVIHQGDTTQATAGSEVAPNPSAYYQSLVPRPLSEAESDALLRAGEDSGDITDKGTFYGDLLMAIKTAKVPLSEIDLARIIQAHSTPEQILAGGGVGSVGSAGAAALAMEAAPKSYTVISGDTLTSILKQHIPGVAHLSSDGQENAIQNFLRSLTPEEIRQIGIGTDPNKLAIGESLNLERVAQLLEEKQVGGASILHHAEILTTPKGVPGAESVIEKPSGQSVAEGATPISQHFQGGTGSASDTLSAAHTPPTLEQHASSVAWRDLPEEVRLSSAQAEAQRYLEDDVSTLYGPPSKFGYWPREWTSLSARNADAVLSQTKATDPHTLLPGSDEIPKGYEWPVVEKIKQYMIDQGLTRENGYVPGKGESLGEFLKRAQSEKIMSEGPYRPPQKPD